MDKDARLEKLKALKKEMEAVDARLKALDDIDTEQDGAVKLYADTLIKIVEDRDKIIDEVKKLIPRSQWPQ